MRPARPSAPRRTSWHAAIVVAAGALACADVPAPGNDSTGAATATGFTTWSPTTTTLSEGSSSETLASSDDGANSLPPVPLLASPSDGALEVPLETSLCWTPVIDPDDDAVRYRVFVDDTELTNGVQGDEPGFEGPCVGPLLFAGARSFAWAVQAFERDDPGRTSERSATWSFTTVADSEAHVVFEDRFEDDGSWTVSGDASAGAWVRGNPVPTLHTGVRAQPDRCDGGDSCMFTGQNPNAIVDDEDVAGGATVLLSPPFDLSGWATATVQLRRYLYKSDADATTALRIELLAPNAAAPDGFDAYELEALAAATIDDPQNRWTPREYLGCGLPRVDGMRLRITARDDGTGIVEAAIDTVAVIGHERSTACSSGEGGACDPTLGEAACPDALSCCPQGTIHTGAWRCTTPVAGLDYDNPTASPDDPGNGPLGCPAPDLTIVQPFIMPVLTDVMVDPDSCLLYEGCVDAPGLRTILRFDLVTPNVGARDLALGVAANNPDVFHYSACHDHYHFDEYASYELRDATEGLVAAGQKLGFCLLDSYSWAWPTAHAKFDCLNQGISRGFADIYESALPCQWIDVTDVPAGEYTLRATVNPARSDAALPLLVERDYGNNIVTVPVTLP